MLGDGSGTSCAECSDAPSRVDGRFGIEAEFGLRRLNCVVERLVNCFAEVERINLQHNVQYYLISLVTVTINV